MLFFFASAADGVVLFHSLHPPARPQKRSSTSGIFSDPAFAHKIIEIPELYLIFSR